MAPLMAAVAVGELQRHRRGHIGVVMRYFPRSSFSLIDVRHANLGSELLSAELGLDLLDANFVGDLPSEADKLVFQFNLPFRRPLSYLLPSFPNFGPPHLSSAQRMHRCDG